MILPLCHLLVFIVPVSAAQHAPAGANGASPDRFANNACVRCHENLSGRLGEIVMLEWRGSVHYANGVGCEGCHGGDASVRPEQFAAPRDFKDAAHLARDPKFLTIQQGSEQFVSRTRGRDVSYFCGKCHAVVKEKHLGSPHGANGDPTCLYCHARNSEGRATHLIVSPTLDIIDPRGREESGHCSPCHQAPTMQAVGQIKKTLLKTSAMIDDSSHRYEELERRGYRSLELAGLHEHGKEVQSRLRRVFHSFDMREINNFAGEIQALSERITRTDDLLNHVSRMRRQQTIVGLCVCGFLLGFAGLLLYYKRHFCLKHGGGIESFGSSAPGAH